MHLSRLHVSFVAVTSCVLLHHLRNETLSAQAQATCSKAALANAAKLAHMPVFLVVAKCAPADVGDIFVPPRCRSDQESRQGQERTGQER